MSAVTSIRVTSTSFAVDTRGFIAANALAMPLHWKSFPSDKTNVLQKSNRQRADSSETIFGRVHNQGSRLSCVVQSVLGVLTRLSHYKGIGHEAAIPRGKAQFCSLHLYNLVSRAFSSCVLGRGSFLPGAFSRFVHKSYLESRRLSAEKHRDDGGAANG